MATLHYRGTPRQNNLADEDRAFPEQKKTPLKRLFSVAEIFIRVSRVLESLVLFAAVTCTIASFLHSVRCRLSCFGQQGVESRH